MAERQAGPRRSVSANHPIFQSLRPGECILGRAASDRHPLFGGSPAPPPTHAKEDSEAHSPTCVSLPTTDDEAKFHESLKRSNTVLEEWACQLQQQEREAKQRSRSSVAPRLASKKMSKVAKVPDAWARFPSHTREERNAEAGPADNVKQRDFAVKDISDTGDITWSTDKSNEESPGHKSITRSFSDKFAKPLKHRLSRYFPGRSSTPSRARSTRGARRSSIQSNGALEYPELELLPTEGGYREIRNIEQEIDEMKGTSSLNRRVSSHKVAAQGDKTTFSAQMATALHHDGSSDVGCSKISDLGSAVEEQASVVVLLTPETPATQIRYPGATHTKISLNSALESERFVTPLSHLSFETDEPPRPVTPRPAVRWPNATISPGSAKSDSSLIRIARFAEIYASSSSSPSSSQGRPDSPSGTRAGCLKRQSAPMLKTTDFDLDWNATLRDEKENNEKAAPQEAQQANDNDNEKTKVHMDVSPPTLVVTASIMGGNVY